MKTFIPYKNSVFTDEAVGTDLCQFDHYVGNGGIPLTQFKSR